MQRQICLSRCRQRRGCQVALSQQTKIHLRQPAHRRDSHQCAQRPLTSVLMPVCASASLGAGGGDAGLHSGQYMIASNCVSASQRTRLSRESGPLKSDSHSGKGAPKGSSYEHSMQAKAMEFCRHCLHVYCRTDQRWMLQSLVHWAVYFCEDCFPVHL